MNELIGAGRRRPTIGTGVGDGSGWPALAWALEEAAETDSRLEICHVCPADSPLAGHASQAGHASRAGRGAVPVGLLELVDPPLARAVGAARARLGGDRVTLTVHTGRVDAALLRAGTTADLMVLGAGGMVPGAGGRTAHQVAAHAHCPTVLVRPDTAARRGPFAGQVVVGVDGSRPARAALEFGFAYASAHRRPLAAVHVTGHGGLDRYGDELLAAEVEPWSDEYPGVPVTLAVRPGRPVPGLLGAAAGARLLVVGHRGRGRLVSALLGSVAHGVIDQATGPVVVTHPDDAPVRLFDSRHGQLLPSRP